MGNDNDVGFDEAKALLHNAELARSRKTTVKKEAAGKALFSQLRQLDKVHGFEVIDQDPDAPVLHLKIGHAHISVSYNRDGFYVDLRGDTKETEVALDFDIPTERYVGREPDRFRHPVPGEAPRRRPALAVVVEALLKQLERSDKPSG